MAFSEKLNFNRHCSLLSFGGPQLYNSGIVIHLVSSSLLWLELELLDKLYFTRLKSITLLLILCIVKVCPSHRLQPRNECGPTRCTTYTHCRQAPLTAQSFGRSLYAKLWNKCRKHSERLMWFEPLDILGHQWNT